MKPKVDEGLLLQLADLAHLNLNEEDLQSLRGDLDRLIDFVGLIGETEALETSSHNVTLGRRPDRPQSCSPAELLELSSRRDGAFVRVPKIVDSDA